jgi:hypothetical protein
MRLLVRAFPVDTANWASIERCSEITSSNEANCGESKDSETAFVRDNGGIEQLDIFDASKLMQHYKHFEYTSTPLDHTEQLLGSHLPDHHNGNSGYNQAQNISPPELHNSEASFWTADETMTEAPGQYSCIRGGSGPTSRPFPGAFLPYILRKLVELQTHLRGLSAAYQRISQECYRVRIDICSVRKPTRYTNVTHSTLYMEKPYLYF